MSRVQQWVGCAVLGGLVAWAWPGTAQQGSRNGEWRAYSSDPGSTRYAALDQITRDNVRDLQVAWTWRFDNFGGGTSQTTPLMVAAPGNKEWLKSSSLTVREGWGVA
jgi:hypothetical protein